MWVADFGNMDDYSACLEALMIKYGVKWKQFTELDSDLMGKAIEFDFDIASVFDYAINDKSKDQFENFQAVCVETMSFHQMYSITNKTAA